jgi:hypothetical protein
MVIELSDLVFTEQGDIIPPFGQDERILNTYIANTLAGNDIIHGNFVDHPYYSPEAHYGFKNQGVLNTDDGNDIISGRLIYGRFGGHDNAYNIVNLGTLNTGEGDDLINGSNHLGNSYALYHGLLNEGTLNAGDGNDTITGLGRSGYGFVNQGTLNTEEGNDIITAITNYNGLIWGPTIGFSNQGGTLNTGEGNDTITANGISSWIGSTINTGNGEDSIISEGTFYNAGGMFLGDGNDSLTSTNYDEHALENNNFIGTGDGDDIITSSGVIYNQGIIDTGNGHDSIIVEGGYDDITGGYYSINNNSGSINTGDGNDSIITNADFQAGENSSGSVFLGEGEDYIKGFGNGDVYGGNGNDTLELTPGTYTVGIWGEGGESPIFTKGNQLMITSQFETLIAGAIMHNFASLTAGQIINVTEV